MSKIELNEEYQEKFCDYCFIRTMQLGRTLTVDEIFEIEKQLLKEQQNDQD